LLLIGFAIVSLGVWVLGRSVAPSPNPFAAYADIFPGQPASAVEARKFLCSSGLYNYLQNEHCTINPTTGAFSQVGVVLSDEIIIEISFRLRGDTFRVGDLMLLWGAPMVYEYSRSVYLHWRSQGVFALVRGYSEFSLYLPIPRIAFVNSEALLVFQ
jgi:hypothetical protein